MAVAALFFSTIAVNTTGSVYAQQASTATDKMPQQKKIRAFPSAEGYGAGARGGRGGKVLFVTSLADSGEGTLRACVEARFPRTCIFRVSGTITLETEPLNVDYPYLTIAGETAPGGGIAIRNSPIQLLPSLQIRSHNVIVRHIRLRPGPHAVDSCCSGALGMYSKNAHDIIIDHVSASWGSDETVDSQDARNVTIQWSIISEPLLNGGPGKRRRARNMLLARGGNFSVHHNLFAAGQFRNPQIAPSISGTTTDIINNVLYSPQWQYVISFDDKWTEVKANIIGNFKIAGVQRINDRLVHIFETSKLGFKLFFAGNYDETYIFDNVLPQSEALAANMRRYIVDEPIQPLTVTYSDAQTAYERVLGNAGATKPVRDEVDERVIQSVRDRTGAFLKNNPSDVGGWPELSTAAIPADEDEDGLPDQWELDLGLNPKDASDGQQDLDGDGWTNLEEYLHELAGDTKDNSVSR